MGHLHRCLHGIHSISQINDIIMKNHCLQTTSFILFMLCEKKLIVMISVHTSKQTKHGWIPTENKRTVGLKKREKKYCLFFLLKWQKEERWRLKVTNKPNKA